MKLTHVSLINWRNFGSLEVDIHNRLFIVGPNASGKSNFLDALKFLADVTRPGGGLTYALNERGGMKSVRFLNALNRNHGNLTIAVQIADGDDQWTYELSLHSRKNGDHGPEIVKEEVTKNGRVVVSRPSADDEADPELLSQTHIEQNAMNREFRDVAKFLAAINSMPENPEKKPLANIQTMLQAVVPGLTMEAADVGKPYPVECSEGTLHLIGLLGTIFAQPTTSSSVLLLKTPERSLNATIVRNLPQMIASAQANRKNQLQVFLSTHSPDLLADEGIHPQEVLVLQVNEDGTYGQLLAEIDEVQTDLAVELPIPDIVQSLINPKGLEPLVAL